MKRIIGMSAKCILALVLTVGITYKLGGIVSPIDTDVDFNAIDTFHNMPENTLEVIGYGSSIMWCSLNPMELYEKYGIGAYNYGAHWQHFNTTALFIKDSLRTQSPKVILIETSRVNSLLQDVDIDGEIYYTRGIPEFKGKQEYLKQCFQNDIRRYLSYYVPLYAFHSNWADLREGNFLENTSDRNFYATMGYFSRADATPVTIPDPSAIKQSELSEAAISVLDEIVSICNENSVEIIFYTAPWQGTFVYSDAMKVYAQKNGCVFFNLFEYMDRIGIDCETDFYNGSHLNDSGAAKVTDFLGEYIVNNYDVTDWRTVEGNIWGQNLQ